MGILFDKKDFLPLVGRKMVKMHLLC